MSINTSIKKLAEAGIVEQSTIIGCTSEEIINLEKFFKVKLPSTYVEFLHKLGKNAGSFLVGSDFLYDKLYKLTEYANNLLIENKSSLKLPEAAFVFISHQGYQFMFFNCNEASNAIYYYLEGEQAFEKVYNSFDDWLAETVQDEIDAVKSL